MLTLLLTALVVAPMQASVPRDSLLYRMTLVRDFTGDGVDDTVSLIVTGQRLERAVVTLRVRSLRHDLLTDTWQTTAYLGDAPGASDLTSSRDSAEFIRWKLQRAIAAYSIPGDYAASPPAIAPEEWIDITRNTKYALGISRGYEREEAIAWNRRKGRFITIEGCC